MLLPRWTQLTRRQLLLMPIVCSMREYLRVLSEIIFRMIPLLLNITHCTPQRAIIQLRTWLVCCYWSTAVLLDLTQRQKLVNLNEGLLPWLRCDPHFTINRLAVFLNYFLNLCLSIKSANHASLSNLTLFNLISNLRVCVVTCFILTSCNLTVHIGKIVFSCILRDYILI